MCRRFTKTILYSILVARRVLETTKGRVILFFEFRNVPGSIKPTGDGENDKRGTKWHGPGMTGRTTRNLWSPCRIGVLYTITSRKKSYPRGGSKDVSSVWVSEDQKRVSYGKVIREGTGGIIIHVEKGGRKWETWALWETLRCGQLKRGLVRYRGIDWIIYKVNN